MTEKHGLRRRVRGIAFTCAAIALLGGGVLYEHHRANEYRRMLEAEYAQSLSALAGNLSNISVTLKKGVYVATPSQKAALAAALLRDTAAAKAQISALPVAELHLTNTNRFLSQIGEYAMLLARKSVTGEEVSEAEEQSYNALGVFAAELSDHVALLEQGVDSDGSIMGGVEAVLLNPERDPESESVSSLLEGLQALESTFETYPELNYDGLYSDHLENRQPAALKNAAPVTLTQAKDAAARAPGLEPTARSPAGEETSALESYLFSAEGVQVGVTKRGGFITYYSHYREVGGVSISAEQAVTYARAYVQKLGITGMQETYYRVYGNRCIVNFAATQDAVLLYPDLVQVEIAMDNGDVLSCNARGYLYNHTERTLPAPTLTPLEAEELAGKNLTVQSTRLVVIPTDGGGEKFCYELMCRGRESDDRLAVYIGAATGYEEDVKLLLESEDGVVVK